MYATVAAAAALHQVLLRSLGEDKVVAQNAASGLFCALFVALDRQPPRRPGRSHRAKRDVDRAGEEDVARPRESARPRSLPELARLLLSRDAVGRPRIGSGREPL